MLPWALRQAQEGLAACQRGLAVGFTTAAALVNELMEARDERRLVNLQRQLSRLNLLIIDELGFVPLSQNRCGTALRGLQPALRARLHPGTTNLPFDEWTEVFGSERLTGALLDRLTHHVHILEMNGESYRLKHSRENAASPSFRRTGRRIDRTGILAPSYLVTSPLCLISCLQSSGRWYTIPPPHWPNFSEPLTWARTAASKASVLASVPVALAKSRTWRGLTTTTGSAAADRGGHQRQFQSARGLQQHQGGTQIHHPDNEFLDPGLVVADHPSLSRRPDGNIDLGL